MKKRIYTLVYITIALLATNTSVAQTVASKYPSNVKKINFEKVAKKEAKQTTEDGPEQSVWMTVGDGCSWYCGGGPDTVTATSQLEKNGKITYDGKNIHDYTFKTAWVEGVKGHGKGESVTYHFGEYAPRITHIIVANGYVKSNKAWKENSRVKTLKLYYNDKPVALLQLEDIMGIQTFNFEDTPFGTPRKENGETINEKPWTLRFEIVDVYPGSKYDDTAISEIYFDGLDVHCFVKGTLIQTDLNGTEKPIETLKEGDKVVTFANSTYKETRIKSVARKAHTDFVRYTFANSIKVTSTPCHPFLLQNGQWASSDPKKSAQYKGMTNISLLKEGDVVKGATNGKVVGIIRLKEAQESYTIVELEDGDNFIANGFIVATEALK